MAKKETGRQCSACDFAWYAVAPKQTLKVDKPRWYDEGGLFSPDPTGRMTRRVANYDREQRKIEDWAKCPNCGSRKVKSPREQRSFEPTGRIVQQPVAATAAPPAFAPTAAASWAPSARQGSATAQPAGFDWEPIKRLYLRHWRLLWAALFAVAPLMTLGDGSTYTHAAWLNVLQFVGTLVVSWAVAAFFLTLPRRRRMLLV